jgi:hypothetical protein
MTKNEKSAGCEINRFLDPIHRFEGTLVEGISQAICTAPNPKKASKKYPSFTSFIEKTRQSIGTIQGIRIR